MERLLRSGPREAAVRPPHIAGTDRTGGFNWSAVRDWACTTGRHSCQATGGCPPVTRCRGGCFWERLGRDNTSGLPLKKPTTTIQRSPLDSSCIRSLRKRLKCSGETESNCANSLCFNNGSGSTVFQFGSVVIRSCIRCSSRSAALLELISV